MNEQLGQNIHFPDYIGIYAAPTEQVVSLFPPARWIDEKGKEAQKVNTAQGLILLECQYTCELIGQGNHRVMEALFHEKSEDSFQTTQWAELKSLRVSLLSQQFTNHCAGIVEGQLKSLNANTPIELKLKIQYQAIRLLTQTERVLQEKQPEVILSAEERNYLNNVRKNEVNQDELGERINQLKANIEKLKQTSKLQKKFDRDGMNQWLIKLRKEQLQ